MSPSLRARIEAVSRRALESGTLQPIPTTWESLREGDATFGVRIVDNLRRKKAAQCAKTGSGKPAHPFVDYEPDLHVGDVAPAHRILLNKFNVIEHHALIVTREFVPQTVPLTPADMHAALACLAEIDGLLFYNGGQAAGASQPHKHLQLVPRSLGPYGLPLEPQIDAALNDEHGLAFTHALDRVSLDKSAAEWHALYCDQLVRIGRDPRAKHVQPYNWLATRDWMLSVPRSRSEVDGIGINGLAFAGAFLVKDWRQRDALKRRGATRLLQQSTA